MESQTEYRITCIRYNASQCPYMKGITNCGGDTEKCPFKKEENRA